MQTGRTFDFSQKNSRIKIIIQGKVLSRNPGLAIPIKKSRILVQNRQDKVGQIVHFEEKDKPQ